jgi:hypothetical protein
MRREDTLSKKRKEVIYNNMAYLLSSSGQSFWLTGPEVQVRFPTLPDFPRSSGSGTGSTQPLEYN